jgi:hypothetical protein
MSSSPTGCTRSASRLAHESAATFTSYPGANRTGRPMSDHLSSRLSAPDPSTAAAVTFPSARATAMSQSRRAVRSAVVNTAATVRYPTGSCDPMDGLIACALREACSRGSVSPRCRQPMPLGCPAGHWGTAALLAWVDKSSRLSPGSLRRVALSSERTHLPTSPDATARGSGRVPGPSLVFGPRWPNRAASHNDAAREHAGRAIRGGTAHHWS